VGLTVSERTELLRSKVARDLLDFELSAHGEIVRAATSAERRQVYARVYERWPALVRAFNEYRGSTGETMGFAPVYLRWFTPWLRGRRVLEVGCGEGRSTTHLADLASQATGVDVSPSLIASANSRTLGKAQFHVADVSDQLPFRPGSFDTVYWNDVAEHLHPDDLESALREIRRVLSPRGVLCTVTCHVDDGPHDASMLVLPRGFQPLGVHIQEFTYGTWNAILRRSGFRPRLPIVGINLVTRIGALRVVDPLTRAWGLSRLAEDTAISRASWLVRWAAGTNVVCSLGEVAS
jgi:SAM-dependent methyltransferase